MNGMWVNLAGPAGGRNVVCLSVRPSVSLAALRGFGSEHEPGIPWAPPLPIVPLSSRGCSLCLAVRSVSVRSFR